MWKTNFLEAVFMEVFKNQKTEEKRMKNSVMTNEDILKFAQDQYEKNGKLTISRHNQVIHLYELDRILLKNSQSLVIEGSQFKFHVFLDDYNMRLSEEDCVIYDYKDGFSIY